MYFGKPDSCQYNIHYECVPSHTISTCMYQSFPIHDMYDGKPDVCQYNMHKGLYHLHINQY